MSVQDRFGLRSNTTDSENSYDARSVQTQMSRYQGRNNNTSTSTVSPSSMTQSSSTTNVPSYHQRLGELSSENSNSPLAHTHLPPDRFGGSRAYPESYHGTSNWSYGADHYRVSGE